MPPGSVGLTAGGTGGDRLQRPEGRVSRRYHRRDAEAGLASWQASPAACASAISASRPGQVPVEAISGHYRDCGEPHRHCHCGPRRRRRQLNSRTATACWNRSSGQPSQQASHPDCISSSPQPRAACSGARNTALSQPEHRAPPQPAKALPATFTVELFATPFSRYKRAPPNAGRESVSRRLLPGPAGLAGDDP